MPEQPPTRSTGITQRMRQGYQAPQGSPPTEGSKAEHSVVQITRIETTPPLRTNSLARFARTAYRYRAAMARGPRPT